MSLCNTKNTRIVEKLAVTDSVDWENKNKLPFAKKYPTLVLLFAMLSVHPSRALRERRCVAAAVISGSVAARHILN